MKKLFALVGLVLLSTSLIACRGERGKEFKVGLIASEATLQDNGYNQFAVAGLNKIAAEYDNVSIKTVDFTTPANITTILNTLGEQEYDLVFTLEYNFETLILNYAGGNPIAKRYPNTTYVVFNEFANTNDAGERIHDNVIEILFSVNESSFLAGALSVLVNENRDLLLPTGYNFADDRALAFVGGSNSNGIRVFGYGYVEGANHIAQELEVNYRYYENTTAGFGASAANANMVKEFYNQGVNIVYGAAGGVASNIRNEAETAKRLMVDVDANQDALKPGHVLTSVLKKTDAVTYDITKELLEGTLKDGATTRYYDLKSLGTGITDLATISGFLAQTDPAAAKWAEIKQKIQNLETAIIAGEIDVVDAQRGETLDTAALTNITFAN
ncbi:MAG: Membrane lipoprotein TmpC precursor [Tenericutes bacterium ADurb.Bin239]|nr:MAG: Membrane lipoprotein TmpC precursor [Tenericutes bacterium ADurb.Bin239]